LEEDSLPLLKYLNHMKNLGLLILFCLVHTLSISQETLNQTDSKGMKQGNWVGKYPSGALKYEGKFDNNKPVGEWKRYHENGKVKALMSYRLLSERVFAVLFDDEGILYAKGVFDGTLRDSTWNFFKGDLVVRTENYRMGKKEGKATMFDKEGKVISVKEWKNDLPDGMAIDYYPNGKIRSEVSFVQGKRNGKALFYDENGFKSMEGSYLDDLSDGDWNQFGKDGKLLYRFKYVKGEIVNKGELDSLQIKASKQIDRARGKIPEPTIDQTGLP
jgi:antitoxin component YwqK of YwqJK toxin-antitoxin module